MILVAPIFGIIAVVLTASFLLRVGRPLYREKRVTSVYALGIGFIAYIAANLMVRLLTIHHSFDGIGLMSSGFADSWLYLRQAVTIVYLLVSLAVLVYLAILVRRDFVQPIAPRSILKDSLPMVAMAFSLVGLSLFQNI